MPATSELVPLASLFTDELYSGDAAECIEAALDVLEPTRRKKSKQGKKKELRKAFFFISPSHPFACSSVNFPIAIHFDTPSTRLHSSLCTSGDARVSLSFRTLSVLCARNI